MKNKILTSLMAATMVMGSTIPVFAATTEEQNVSQTEADPGTTRETEVKYSQGSTFTVTIPKTIVLDGQSKAADYNVNVKGDIASDKQVTVAPQDAINSIEGINFYMKDQSSSTNKKNDVEANVTQESTVWTSAEVAVINTGTTKTGNVASPKISAGSWRGVFTFNISMDDTQ